MRRSRGGNARKQKRELTDATFLSVISGHDETDTAAVAAGAGAAVQEPLDEQEDDFPAPPARSALHEQGLAPINGFVFSRYRFGAITCAACHCELMYYQDRELLRHGFTFRCRVCQSLQTITLSEE